MTRNREEKILRYLYKETDEIIDLKEEIWEKVQTETIKNLPVQYKRSNRIMLTASILAVFVILISTLFTSTGQALIQSIQDLFEKEKRIELNIEGTKEDIDVELEVNETLNYVIYIDESRYKIKRDVSSDKIVTKEKFEDIPEVMMEITKKQNTTQIDEITAIKEKLKLLEMDIRLEEEIEMPFNGIMISAIGKGASNKTGKNGSDWDSPIYRYYVMKEKNDALYLIEERLFLEAAEGHGARFQSMLETFEVIVE